MILQSNYTFPALHNKVYVKVKNEGISRILNCLVLGDIISETELMYKYQKIKDDLFRWNLVTLVAGALIILGHFLYSIRFSFIYAKSIEVPLQEVTLLLKNISFASIFHKDKRTDLAANRNLKYTL